MSTKEIPIPTKRRNQCNIYRAAHRTMPTRVFIGERDCLHKSCTAYTNSIGYGSTTSGIWNPNKCLQRRQRRAREQKRERGGERGMKTQCVTQLRFHPLHSRCPTRWRLNWKPFILFLFFFYLKFLSILLNNLLKSKMS